MITYANLSKHPHAAPSLIGMPLAAFDQLYAEFAEAHRERLCHVKLTRRTKAGRQRAVGAGRKHRYDLRDRLLMTLFWLRTYTTYEVLSFFYNLNKTNDELAIHFRIPMAMKLGAADRGRLSIEGRGKI
jgi:hypothetical protein